MNLVNLPSPCSAVMSSYATTMPVSGSTSLAHRILQLKGVPVNTVALVILPEAGQSMSCVEGESLEDNHFRAGDLAQSWVGLGASP